MLKIGHRGARAHETENTIKSFQSAIEKGANAIELDVRATKDGRLAVVHDENLKRVFGTDIFVKDASLKELKALTDGRIVELKEALDFIDKKVQKIFIELKETGLEKKTLSLVKKLGLSDRAVIISFSEDVLKAVRAADKNIETGLVYARHKNPLKAALQLNAQYLVGLYRFVHRENVLKAHENNLKIIVWTINDPEEARQYKDKGVDGIATDMPEILKAI